jgi:hypothetical protein
MIGSLAFDPFLQAIISSEGRLDEIPVPRVPTIGRSTGADFGTAMPMETYFYKKGFNYHDPNDANDTATGDLEVGVSPTTNFAIAGSVLNGFYNSTSFRNQTVGFRCKTGNCTWPIFSSLAVCTSCVDVSNHIKSKSYPGGDYSRTTYKLPYAQIENNDGRKGKHPWDRTEVVINSTAHPQQTISFTDKDTLLISFLAMLGAPSWRSNQTNWNESKPEAYECALLLCANAYESKSRDGILEENIVGSWSQRNPTSYRPLHSGYNATELAAFETALGPSLYKVYDNLTIERTALQLMIPPQESTFLPENAPRLFNFTYLDIIGTIDYLRQLSKKSQSWPYAGNGDTGPSVPEMLGKSTNITLTFERVGKSMTDQIRDLAASPVSGTAYRWTTHVNVEWAYLTLPVLMILFGCIHVILTIVESRKLGLPAWKEDTLPVLLHGFNDHIQNLLRDAQTDPKAAKAAESVLISFSEDKNRLRIVS